MWAGSRGKGWKEGHSRLEGTVHQPVQKPTFPLSKHQAQYLGEGKKKKKKSFWLLGHCWPPSPQVRGQAGKYHPHRRWTPHPWSFGHRGSSNS